MIRLDPSHLRDYLEDDAVLRQLAAAPAPFTSQRWMLESAPKRMIYARMYGDLLDRPARRRVVDVGGGCSALTAQLAERHDYTLVDLLAHDPLDSVRAMERAVGREFVVAKDWYEYSPGGNCDLVVANDLFPNVDQRLRLFLDRFLPRCRELRVLLTYHNSPRFHSVKRTDADEIMWMLAWSGDDIARVLEPFRGRLIGPARGLDLASLLADGPSLYANNRQVALARLRGDLWTGEGEHGDE